MHKVGLHNSDRLLMEAVREVKVLCPLQIHLSHQETSKWLNEISSKSIIHWLTTLYYDICQAQPQAPTPIFGQWWIYFQIIQPPVQPPASDHPDQYCSSTFSLHSQMLSILMSRTQKHFSMGQPHSPHGQEIAKTSSKRPKCQYGVEQTRMSSTQN